MPRVRPRSPTASAPVDAPSRSIFLIAALLVTAAVIAYAGSLHGPFVFDDLPAIVRNPTLRQLWPPQALFTPPVHSTVSGRPGLNVSFALNYAANGLAVPGYHLVNVAIHVAAGLLLFGVIRRTLRAPALSSRFENRELFLSAAVALLWLVHPLQTESVTYVVQRAESLSALFYLATLYGVIRAATSAHSRRWQAFAVVACFIGVTVKETLVTAPVIAFAWDRFFFAGSFREAWRQRGKCYLGLALSWVLLGALVSSTGGTRGGSAGFGSGIAWWEYALLQSRAILHYLRLVIWPRPLVIDYGPAHSAGLATLLPMLVAIALLLTITAVALIRRPIVGFVGLFFWAVLAPSSSIVPVATQGLAEHRMYLALAAPLLLFVLALDAWLTRSRRTTLAIVITASLALGLVTTQRNREYQSSLALWTATVRAEPENPRAQDSLGTALLEADRVDEAIVAYQNALRLEPNNADATNNLGTALEKKNDLDGAIAQYQRALQLDPAHAKAHFNLGNAYSTLRRADDAIAEFQRAIQLDPTYAKAHVNLGNILLHLRRVDEAAQHYQEALRLDPEDFRAHHSLGSLFARTGHLPEAINEYKTALKLWPNFIEAHDSLGDAFFQIGHLDEAIAHYRASLALAPDSVITRYNLAGVLQQLGRTAEAESEFEEILREKPDMAEARAALAALRAAPHHQ